MATSKEPEQPGLVEPSPIADVFIEGIGRIERLAGGNFRFVLYVTQEDADGRHEHVVVMKLVASLAVIPAMLRQVGALVTTVREVLGLLN